MAPVKAPPAAAATVAEPATAGVWGVTLWTARRAPLLVGLDPAAGVALTLLGRLAQAEWHALEGPGTSLVLGEFTILPDRLRGLVHVTGGPAALGQALARFTARAGGARSGHRGPVWERRWEACLLLGPEELESWRRRIRAGAAGIFREGWTPR